MEEEEEEELELSLRQVLVIDSRGFSGCFLHICIESFLICQEAFRLPLVKEK